MPKRKRSLTIDMSTDVPDEILSPSGENSELRQSATRPSAAEDAKLFDPKSKWPDDCHDDFTRQNDDFLPSDPESLSKWLYPSQIRAWVAACDSGHGDHCQSSRRDHPLPSWLIDCEAARIIKPTSEKPYVALSYVWGATSSGMALKEKINDLQINGALMDDSIPTTIRNVIQIIPRSWRAIFMGRPTLHRSE